MELNYSSKIVSNSIIKQVAQAYDKLLMAHVSEIEAGKNFKLQPIKVIIYDYISFKTNKNK